MSETIVERTPSAYPYPLLIKRLLDNPIRQFPNQGIVYGDFKRQTYRELGERIHRLASSLTGLGVQPGATVAMMDWDSHRYLECFFAVPMMGAVLPYHQHPPDARSGSLHDQPCQGRCDPGQRRLPADPGSDPRPHLPVKKWVLLNDTGQTPTTTLDLTIEYETLLATADATYPFPDFSEDTRATTFYTTGTTGLPKGVYFTATGN